MRRFTELFRELDQTTRTTRKVEAMAAYFREVPPSDAAWALALLTGQRRRRPVSSADLRAWVADRSGLSLWMVEECYDAVGDLAETLALLLPPPSPDAPAPPSLHDLMEGWVLPLRALSVEDRRVRVEDAWDHLASDERFLYHKVLTGGFRVGVGPRLVTRALAQAAGLEPAILAHRLTGSWDPTAETFLRLTSEDPGIPDPGQPYPFMLAHPLEGDPAALGSPEAWAVEWKWDGIRAQLLHRDGEVLLWSRGEEVITPSFPEVAEDARALPEGTVLDGELLPWRDGWPLPFAQLQRRLGRTRPGRKILDQVPVIFLAYDLLEQGGKDRREAPLAHRRRRLEALWESMGARTAAERAGPGAPEDPPSLHRIPGTTLALAPLVDLADWGAAEALRKEARTRRVEGLMLKDRAAPYRGGRPRGPWWKWKVDPYTLDVVLLYARKGHGRRAGVFTDFTFGVRAEGADGAEMPGDGGQAPFVPVASAYAGLTDAEFREVDRWIRRHVTERFGPVRSVVPELVFEIAFEGIRRSPRHRSGVALRFPRMKRWRRDKTPGDADTLGTVLALLPPEDG